MVRPGRVVMPMQEAGQASTWNFWRNTPVLKQGLLEVADLPAGKDLLQIEDLSEEALPSTTSLTHSANAAEKYHQLGLSAWSSVLKGSLSELSNGTKKPCLVIDLAPHTGDLQRAIAQERFKGSIGLDIHFLAFHADEMEMEWATQSFTEYVFDKFLQGEFDPIVPLPPKEKPDEMAMPTQPTLSLLAYSKVKQGGLVTLKTPDKVMLAWHDNPNHGLHFQTFLEEQRKNHFLDCKAEDGKGEKPCPRKKEGKLTAPEDKTVPGPEQPVSSVLASEVPTPWAYEAVTVGNADVKIVIAIGQRVYLINTSETSAAFKKGSVLGGYFKGKFWSKKDEDSETVLPGDVPFQLRSGRDEIFLNGKCITVQECVTAKRQISPADATIAYHVISDAPTSSISTVHFQKRIF